MALESVSHINQLVVTNPSGADQKAQGDDHIRLIKDVLVRDLPNIGGVVTPTHTELNFVDGVTGGIQAQLDALAEPGVPLRTVGTFTVTQASPAVFTLVAHGLIDGTAVRLSTTGALYTGLAVLTTYFIKYLTVDTFKVSATLNGADINTSGVQSGVHTLKTFLSAMLAGANKFEAPNTFTPVQHFTAGIGPDYLQNIGLAASVASGALTVALKTAGLTDPSVVSPVGVAFRNRTETNGNSVTRSIVAAASIIVPSGATISNHYLYTAPITLTVASPCVVTHYDANLVENQAVQLDSVSGTLPTGLVDGTVYYVKNLSGFTFNVSATPGGAAINTSGSLTGTPYAYYVDTAEVYVYLCDDGSTREVGICGKPLFSENKLYNTIAVSTAADDGFTLYTTNTMTNAAVRLVGKVELQPSLPVASWDTAPTRVSLLTSSQLTGPLVVTRAKGTGITSITAVPQNFGGTVQVEVDDLVTLDWITSFTVGAGDYTMTASFVAGGTCLLESPPQVNNPMSFEFLLHGGAALSGFTVRECQSVTRKVTKAGTFSMSSASSANYGTALTNAGCLVAVTIIRPNR